jgi:hypothetical protein
MEQIDDRHVFQQQVIDEIRLLQARLPEWRSAGPYADHLRPLDPLERREAERLDRLLRRERAAWGERTRERAMREQAHPWSEEERWTLRKRVWRERRDRERELLDQRERTLLEREDELLHLGARFERWLAELEQLEPEARSWCAEQAQLGAAQGITPSLLDQLHRRRARAAGRHARGLLARTDLRDTLAPALRGIGRDPILIARAIAPLLAPDTPESPAAPCLPVVVAALSLLAAQGMTG